MALINLNFTGTNESVAEITLNRPEVLNALNLALLDELRSALGSLDSKNIKVLVIRGAGERAFSAGADLKERAGMTFEQTRGFLTKINQVFDQVSSLPFPTVAYLNGLAFGGGLELALACDIRLMAPHAQTGLTECSLGIIPGAGGTSRLQTVLGYAKACELIFTAQKISAQEALALGLVNQLSTNPSEFICKIDACPKTSLWAAKEAMKTGEVARCYEQVLNSPERLEALKKFKK